MSSSFTYPGDDALRKFFYRMPLHLWRMGCGWMLPRSFAVLTTTGRKSGAPRHVMVEHTRIGKSFVIISGWGEKSQWVKNLEADPLVTVQTWRDGTVSGKASRVREEADIRQTYEQLKHSPAVKPFLESMGIENTAEAVIANRDRLTIIRIDPTTERTPPPQPQDLTWLWIPVGLIVLILILRSR